MPVTSYRFRTVWNVHGTCEEVFDVLMDATAFPRWWPSVYLAADVIEPGGPDGVGRTVRIKSRGKLPYSLTWTSRISSKTPPTHLAIAASGDFEGTGVWQLRPSNDGTEVTFDWNISVTPWYLRIGSYFLRPIFAANHRWAMARGGESLERELARRRSA
jgi:hypothetical protein